MAAPSVVERRACHGSIPRPAVATSRRHAFSSVDVARLAEMSPAFAGTVTSIEGDVVTLTIDHWYTGGDSATATLHATSGIQAVTDGFALEVGEHYPSLLRRAT